ncbi:hypothetical protein V6N13_125580 [Hibiscus sabdariffa]
MHGDVVNCYITRKKDKLGKRFGFVTLSNKVDVDRATERLNEFVLNGFKLFVSKAKYGGNQQAWRNTSKGKALGNSTTRTVDDVIQKNNLEAIDGKSDEGVDDTYVKTYKKTFKVTSRKKLFNSIFMGFNISSGENANRIIDRDKITMLISTRLRENITKVIELEVGKESFMNNIVELGFQISSTINEKEKYNQKFTSAPEESSLGTSSSNTLMSKEKVSCFNVVKDSYDCCMGNTFKDGVALNDYNERRLVGEDVIHGSCQLVQKENTELSQSRSGWE